MLVISQCRDTENNDRTEENILLDPCFFSTKDYQQSLPDDLRDTLLNHLAHRIQRRPADLTAHIQRLKIYHQCDDREGQYGALLDLFIALGDKGKPLRLRMLRGVSNRLTESQLNLFKAGMEKKISLTDMTPLARYSRLSGAVIGSVQIAGVLTEATQIPQVSLIDEARDLLNSGQIEAAQALLEKALLETPEQETLSLELLMIYRHTHNRDAFRTFHEAMVNRPLAAQAEWNQQAVDFGL